MFAHDALGQPQTQTGAGFAFGGVERLEDAGQILAKYATTVVGENHAHAGTALRPIAARAHPQPQMSPVRDGLYCVDDQVGKKLPEFAREAQNLAMVVELP